MPRIKVTLNHANIHAMLREQFAPVIAEKAEQVRASAQTSIDAMYGAAAGLVVDTLPTPTDRARVAVSITEPNGAAIEARYWVLHAAALRAGLEVTDGD